MTPIKIAYIITGLGTGGAEMMLMRLLDRMDRKAFEPVVISLTDGGAIAGKIKALGIGVHCAGMKRRSIPVLGMIRLIRILRGLKPDIVQGWMYHANLVAQLCSMFIGKKTPVVWGIHGTHTDLSIEPGYTAMTIWLGARFSRFSTRIINCSKISAASHEQRLGYSAGKSVIIPNGFDVELFRPSPEARTRLRAELGLPDESLIIGLVGRYHPVKDHGNFLSAAAHLLKSRPDVRFVLVGEGVDGANPELKNKIEKLRLEKSVHLLGKRDDIPYLTAGFDIAALSSLSEAFPNVLGEAMSCGVPCVATDVGDARYIVGDTGIVVPASDPVALANAWQKLIDMGAGERQSLGQKAQKRIIDNFSLESVVKQYEDLYRQVLQTTKRQQAV